MLWNLIGHEWAERLLREHITQGHLRHAYLITGPEGVGRRTLALRLAQALNCTQPPEPGVPCWTCPACRRIERMQHPDLAVVQAEQAGGTLRVEQVRELQRSLSLAPYEARYRVALFLRFEEANDSAANALLKTLEEPPPQVVLILTADSAESLLPTIVSRCEVIRLSPLPLEAVQNALQAGKGVAEGDARLLAHLSDGRPGRAFQLLENPQAIEQRRGWIADHIRLLAASRAERFAYAEALSKNKEGARQVLLVWLTLWRDVMLRAAGTQASLTNLDSLEWIDQLATEVQLDSAHQAVRSVERTLDLMDKNINLRLALEVLFLDLPVLRAA